MSWSALPAAPHSLLDSQGQPQHGRYQGCITQHDWQALPLNRWQRLLRPLRHKRWQYLALAHADYVIGLAVVDVGWTAAAFAYLFDRRQGKILADVAADSFPLHGAQLADQPFADASFAGRGLTVRFERQGSRLAVEVSSPQLRLAAHVGLDPMPPVLAAIGPANWLAHSTHKSTALAVSGFADCQGQRFSLDGAVASLDYSNGLLARRTDWRWASAHNSALGFNLQQGYMGEAENACWLQGKLYPLSAVEFTFNPQQPLQAWQLRSSDGLLELQFTPEGMRAKNQNLLIASSRYIQAIGRFDGYLTDPLSGTRHVVQALTGVTEDHYARW